MPQSFDHFHGAGRGGAGMVFCGAGQPLFTRDRAPQFGASIPNPGYNDHKWIFHMSCENGKVPRIYWRRLKFYFHSKILLWMLYLPEGNPTSSIIEHNIQAVTLNRNQNIKIFIWNFKILNIDINGIFHINILYFLSTWSSHWACKQQCFQPSGLVPSESH